MRKCNFGHLKEKMDIHKCGSSSFKMHNPKKIFKELGIKKGQNILDLGCGPGDYSIEMARLTGKEGTVYSIDKNEQVIKYLKERLQEKQIENIKASTKDITKTLPFENNFFDLIIIITVLHTLKTKQNREKLFKEISRILKPKGKVITIDCKKEEMNFGPPLSMRITPEELEETAKKEALNKTKLVDVGYNYLMEFQKQD